MEANTIKHLKVVGVQNIMHRLYNEHNINICIGCKFKHTASCDIHKRIRNCKQQLLKYYKDLEFYKSVYKGASYDYSLDC